MLAAALTHVFVRTRVRVHVAAQKAVLVFAGVVPWLPLCRRFCIEGRAPLTDCTLLTYMRHEDRGACLSKAFVECVIILLEKTGEHTGTLVDSIS